MKRMTLIASALCLALGTSISFAQERMGDGKHDAVERDAMSKPSTKRHKADRMEKSDKMDKMEKTDKSDKTDKMDKMDKPSSAY